MYTYTTSEVVWVDTESCNKGCDRKFPLHSTIPAGQNEAPQQPQSPQVQEGFKGPHRSSACRGAINSGHAEQSRAKQSIPNPSGKKRDRSRTSMGTRQSQGSLPTLSPDFAFSTEICWKPNQKAPAMK